MIRVQVPPVLRAVTGGARTVEAEGTTVREVFEDIAKKHPALGLHLFDERSGIRRNIICVHRDVVVRPDEMAERKVDQGEELVLANAFAGG
ncbi:MAG TPA: MoaD/ThiS family protein [Rhizomicrobium sp.]|nr:MoaD/ThiS family protein [Rhizomicrobium sp.]